MKGLPRLVLLPGMDGTGVLFRPLLAALPRAPLVVTYPGDRPLGYDELLPIARAALPGGGGPFVLLGESMSGPIALRLAAEGPAGLRGVVLAASFVTNPVSWLPRAAAALSRPFAFRAAPFWWRVRTLLGPFATPELRALFGELFGKVTPEVMARRGAEILRVDAREALRACPVPILYLRGTRDFIVPARNLAVIRAIRRDVEVVELDASHLVLQVAPRGAADAIEAFLARVADASGAAAGVP